MQKISLLAALMLAVPAYASAQYITEAPTPSDTAAVKAAADTSETIVLTLEDALRIALSENVSVKVADQEVTRTKYAQKGTYASLFPQIDATASFQRTLKKQVMYMDFDTSSYTGGSSSSDDSDSSSSSSSGGFEVGRWNTYSGGVSASMPLVNAQLWKSLEVAGQDVELAVEKARSSRLDMVTEVKQAFYQVLLSKEARDVYAEVYENAVASFKQTEMKYNVDKASELEYNRAKSTVQNAIPDVYNSEASITLALWQLKAVMGVDLDTDIDVCGSLDDYTDEMFRDIHENDDISLENNTSMRQLAIQAAELANTVQMQKYASLPTLALSFSYSMNAMTNDFNFSQYKWTPYSYVGLSLSVPIFAGGKRYHAIKQAQVQYDELALQQKDTERQLMISIHQYLTTMETNMKTYNSAKSAEETARKAYDIAAKSYNVGRSTITELNDSRLQLTQAQLSVSQAIYNFVVAKSNLEKTLGADFTDTQE